MAVKRIVANIATDQLEKAEAFYSRLLGLEQVMDLGWIQTYAGKARSPVQISFASEGGSGTPVPDLSIEVDDIDALIERVRAEGLPMEYGPVDEPWGVRRFFIRDPFGKLLNILSHGG